MKQESKLTRDEVLRAKRGGEAFEQTYAALYGSRWQGIKDAMARGGDARQWNAGGASPYLLDSASILAALALPLADARRVLDCCAAPGGKTIVLATLMHKDAHLTANDRSRERRARLATAVRQCLPSSVEARVTVTTRDAARMGRQSPARNGGQKNREAETFDAILLDAPCSSERHVLESPRHLAQWSPARVKNLRAAQWALLSAAFRLLRDGGYVVYATCALHPAENDGIVNRLLQKFPRAAIMPREEPPRRALEHFAGDLPVPEQTPTGWRVLPDTANGAGPMFFAIIQKNESE